MSFHSKAERVHVRSRKPLGSSTNTRDSLSRKQKSYSKKQSSSAVMPQILMNRSIAGTKSRHEGEDFIRAKQAFLQKCYDKYYKKQRRQQFPNISIIQEKQSILSNNQQNSLDSLNNFIIHGNKHDSSVIQKSNQQSSIQSETEDWTLLQNQYHFLLGQNHQNSQESQYLQVVDLLKKNQSDKDQNCSEETSPIFEITQKIKNLKQQISKLKHLNKKKSSNEESSEVLDNMVGSQSYNQQKSLILNQKSLEFKTSNQILKKSLTSFQRQQLVQQHISKLRIKGSQKSIKKVRKSDRLLQHLSEEENKQFAQQESPQAHYEQAQKDQEEFINYMDKKCSQDNQPNLSLNNISKIMGVRPKQYHNKSIENETQIKEKEDDEVVAMLENQLRGKEIVQIPETEQTQILLKQSRDNLCLNELEGDIQNNIQTSEIQEQTSDQNKKNFFIALEARQKWIKSLQKEQEWTNAELALLSKMKKILHNPYIQFPED